MATTTSMTTGRIRARAPYAHGLGAVPGARRRGAVAAVALVGSGAALLVGAVVPLGSALDVLRGAGPLDRTDLRVTPGLWVANNLALAALVPVTAVIQRSVYGVGGGYLSSVAGRWRWAWSARAAGVLAPVLGAQVVVLRRRGVLGPTSPIGALTRERVALAALAVLTVSLQSAGEEFAFRGLLQRSVSACFGEAGTGLVVSTAVSAIAFVVIHWSADPWAICYFAASGVGMSSLTHVSGGLEASSVWHAVTNVLLVVSAVLSGQLESIAVRPTGPGLLLPSALALAAPALVRVLARHHGLATEGRPPQP